MRQELQVKITTTNQVEIANSEALLLECAANDQSKREKRNIETKLLKLITQYNDHKHQNKAKQKQLLVQLTKYKIVDSSAICRSMEHSQFNRYLEKLFKKTYDEVSSFLIGLKDHLEPKIKSGQELTKRSELLELEFDEETQRVLWAKALGGLKRSQRSARMSRPNYSTQLKASTSSSSPDEVSGAGCSDFGC